ncbi:MAG: hypothetical protein HY525_09495 [Betaproteobacteria bacterium]|nr:hypothetical protein [Betaproteobacteria bacterium]
MKRIIVAVLLVAFTFPAFGRSASVRGHVTKKGVYVQPHNRTTPDKSKANNYSSKGNVNPYTGKPGSVDPAAPRAPRR